jgi:hypothetical protein
MGSSKFGLVAMTHTSVTNLNLVTSLLLITCLDHNDSLIDPWWSFKRKGIDGKNMPWTLPWQQHAY